MHVAPVLCSFWSFFFLCWVCYVAFVAQPHKKQERVLFIFNKRREEYECYYLKLSFVEMIICAYTTNFILWKKFNLQSLWFIVSFFKLRHVECWISMRNTKLVGDHKNMRTLNFNSSPLCCFQLQKSLKFQESSCFSQSKNS